MNRALRHLLEQAQPGASSSAWCLKLIHSVFKTAMTNGLARRVARKTASVCGDICIIGCVIIVLPFWCTAKVCIKCTKAVQHSARQDDRCFLASESSHPLPLPLRRGFNISNENIPLIVQPERSRLMALPYDVRRLIWEFAVGDAKLRILHEDKEQRLYHVALHRRRTFAWFNESCSTGMLSLVSDEVSTATPKSKRWGRHSRQESRPSQPHCCAPAFALLKTCRQIYQEVMPIVYSRNTFIFLQVRTIPFWINSVRRHHMARMRKIRLQLIINKPAPVKDWMSACFCIGTWMKSLEDLEIELELDHSLATLERSLLEPLKEISGIKKFSLTINYTGNVEETRDMKQYRRLIRKLVMRPRGEPWERYAWALRAGLKWR